MKRVVIGTVVRKKVTLSLNTSVYADGDVLADTQAMTAVFPRDGATMVLTGLVVILMCSLLVLVMIGMLVLILTMYLVLVLRLLTIVLIHSCMRTSIGITVVQVIKYQMMRLLLYLRFILKLSFNVI